MKKFMLSIFFALILCINVYANEIEKPTVNAPTVNAPTVEAPTVNAQGAVLMDCKTGRVLWGKNEEMPLAMASTTKIMTAIIALENCKLDEIVTVSPKAASAPEVKMFLQSGEEISMEYLLYALMLQSYNDAAVAIAEHVSGSVEAFCKEMTAKAVELGAKDTVFETPNGLDSGEHHSTAYDMALITRYALNNEKFVEIINTPSVTAYSNRRQYALHNKNRLLNEYAGGNGVKTGFTGKAGQCFVGSAKRDDMQLVSVVLASGWGTQGKEQKWIDTKEILDYGFDNYKYVDIISPEVYTQIDITRSKTPSVDIVYSEGLNLPLNTDEIAGIKTSYDFESTVKAPVEAGQIMGTCTVFIGDDYEKTIDLLAASGAERHDFITSLKKVCIDFLEMGTNKELDLELLDFMG